MKKTNIKWAVVVSTVIVAMLFSCHPDDGSSIKLGSLPNAQFSFVVDNDGHSVTAVSTTKGAVLAYWSVPSLNLGYGDLKGDTAKLNFIFPGTYKITLLVDGHGGADTVSQLVTTSQPDPNACDHSKALGFLASCTSKTWRLLQDAGAYKVGPGPDDGSWWTNGTGDVAARSCEFDDQYTFSFNADGTFVYDSHGDFYDDGYMGNQTNSCEPESNFTPTEAPWGSGTHKFVVIPNTGQNSLGQIKVIGLGAHMGLEKVTTNAEVTSGPVDAITYDILSMTTNSSGDILVIGANMGWGWWTFAFQSY